MFFALVVLVPLVELFVLAQVAHVIGLGNALAALVLVSLVGLALVKRQGVTVWRNLRASLSRHELPNEHLGDGGLLVVAGALLIIPGFVTDALGLALLVPPVRRLTARLAVGRFAFGPGRLGRRRRPVEATYTGAIIDTQQTDRPTDDRPHGGVTVPGDRRELPRP